MFETMKLHHVIVVAVLTTVVFAGDAIAQERMFGNGRFLRRVRDSFTGDRFKEESKPKPKAKESAKKTKPKSAKPTPAAKPKSKAKVPTPAKSKAPEDSSKSRYPDAYKAPELEDLESDITLDVPSNNARKVTRSGPKQTTGFGMLLVSKGDKHVVTRVDPKGNAKKAGLRIGDEVFKAAGIKLQSMDEFNQITDVLREGDQIEVEYRRKGEKEMSLVMFGAPKFDTEDAETIEPAYVEDTSKKSPELTAPGSVLDFVPPQSRANQSNVKRQLGSNRLLEPTQPAVARKSLERLQYERALEQQRLEIEKLNEEIRRLRTEVPVVEAKPVGNSILEIPDLNGPGRQ